MTDLTRPDRGEARARLDATLDDLEDDLALIYCRTVLIALADAAPDVLTFLMGHVDAAFDQLDAALAARQDPTQ